MTRLSANLLLLLLVLCLLACTGSPSPAPSPSLSPTWLPSISITLPEPTSTVPGPTATFPVVGQPVEFMTSDGVHLAGTFFPAAGDTVVIFAHMGISDQTTWQAFAARLADMGMPAFTFDFRCNGLSSCEKGSNITYFTIIDVQAAVEYLHGLGYERIACAGASLGSMACLETALRQEFVGLVFIAGRETYPLDGLAYPRDLVNPGMPKLFIVSEQDRYSIVVTDTPRLYDMSPDPRRLVTYPTSLHGTELFQSEFGEEFSRALLDFLLPLNTLP